MLRIPALLAAMASLLPVHAELIPLDKPADYSAWTAEVGEWSVQDGALLQASESLSRTITWLPGKAYSDIDISVEFYVHPAGSGVRAPGLVYRAQDADTYYYIHYDHKNSQVVWVRSALGNEWTEARRHRPITFTVGEWHTARVVAAGDEHKVYLDGELLFTEKDHTIKSGVVALRTGQARVSFRNLGVEGVPVALAEPFEVRLPAYTTVCADAGAGAYEAFPDVCLTPSGELLCVFYAGYSHVSVPTKTLPKGARICMVRSTDQGKTWSDAQTVVDSAIDDRDPSITQLSNGDLLVVYMTYDPGRKPGTHQVFTVRSTDGGETWGEPQRVPTQFTANEAVSEPAREMPDGRLLLPVYGTMVRPMKQRYVSGLLQSDDQGKTWAPLAYIESGDYELSEPSLVRLPDGKLFMHIRPVMTYSESTDDGRTWTAPKPVGVPGHAPYLLLTGNNVLLSAFRHPTTRSTRAMCSRDGGQTWEEPILIDQVLGAYPSMVELPHGRIICVYYTEGGGSDIRCAFLRVDDEGLSLLPRDE